MSTVHKHEITFVSNKNHTPLKVSEGTCLSEALDTQNSPILFGCRTGICGTCIIRIHANSKTKAVYPPKTDQEYEIIELFAEEQQDLRLACQLHVKSDLHIEAAEGLDS